MEDTFILIQVDSTEYSAIHLWKYIFPESLFLACVLRFHKVTHVKIH